MKPMTITIERVETFTLHDPALPHPPHGCQAPGRSDARWNPDACLVPLL